MAQDPKKIGSTQDFIRFAKIHNGIVITKTGELRAILMATAVNFPLKSEQEQNATIFAYQNFLNSLSFPIQILLQSRRLDLSRYLSKLQETANTQQNELLRAQTMDYIHFVSNLVNIANIMDKKFYIIVPFLPPVKVSTGGLFGGKKNIIRQMTPQEFQLYEEELKQQVQVVQNGLGSIGIRSAQLNTQQIVELFYGVYNPEEAAKQKLIDFNELNSPLVQSVVNKNE